MIAKKMENKLRMHKIREQYLKCLENCETGNIFEKFGPKEIDENRFRRLFEAAGNEITSQNETPKTKTVTPNEVVHLVQQLSAQSDTYRRAICDLVS